MEKIRSFTDLSAWKYGHQLVLKIYAMTKIFPEHERFGLSNQMQRAAVSVTSNIAEGFSRSSSREKRQFYLTARGSLTEIQNQLLIAKDIGYTAKNAFDEAATLSVQVSKLLNGLIKTAPSLGHT